SLRGPSKTRRPAPAAPRQQTRSARWREGEVAKTYAHDPVALQLRAMNMLALESMQLGGFTGMIAKSFGLAEEDKAAQPIVMPQSPSTWCVAAARWCPRSRR